MAATKTLPTFEVDKEGLRKIMARKGAGWILPELIQNAWDEDATTVLATLAWTDRPPKGKTATARVRISVIDDDPDGFSDITHAYTLFAESGKKNDVKKRGRFNVGEKLVIAACDSAEVSTTTGRVIFDETGRKMKPAVRESGTEFIGYLSLTQAEFNEALAVAGAMFSPENVTTTINGEELQHRRPVRTFTMTLPTPIGESLRPSPRKTTVKLYEPTADETPHLYELGIPVVPLIEGGDRWHIDIAQKVPLNIDRDNVTPAYLRDVRTGVINCAHDMLTEEDAAQPWTTEAIASPKIEPAALKTVLTQRFGDRLASFSPRDQEANHIAVSEGYTLVMGGSLPRGAWDNVRKHELVQSSSVLTPSPRAYAPGQANTRKTDPEASWSDGQRRLVRFVKEVGLRICFADITVEFVNDAGCMNFSATYGRSPLSNSGLMEFNVRTLGRRWFDEPIGEKQISLIIHELGHHMESNHLSTNYYAALTNLGARLTLAVADDPNWWKEITA